jgi:hypothetical protein
MDNTPDLYSLMTADAPTSQEQAAALAAALRRQQSAGQLAQLTGDKVLAPFGQQLQAGATKQTDMLAEAGQARMREQMQAQVLANTLRHQQVLEQLAQGNQDLKGNEVTVSRDVMGNPVIVRKHGTASAILNRPRPGGVPPAGAPGTAPGPAQAGQPGPGGPPSSPVDDIAQAIIDGKQPPDTKGLFRAAAPIRAALAKRGFDLSTAQTDWAATQKHLATLNGPQQTRLMQAINTAGESLNNIEQLYNKWTKLGPASGIPLLNRVALAGAKQLPGEAGATARALEMNIADLTAELGNIYMGGNSPTDHALGLAKQNLSADWNEAQFKEAIGQARKNIQYRVNSIRNSGVIGASAGNKYAAPTQAGEAGSPPAAGVETGSASDKPPVPDAVKTKSGKWARTNAAGQLEYL